MLLVLDAASFGYIQVCWRLHSTSFSQKPNQTNLTPPPLPKSYDSDLESNVSLCKLIQQPSGMSELGTVASLNNIFKYHVAEKGGLPCLSEG